MENDSVVPLTKHIAVIVHHHSSFSREFLKVCKDCSFRHSMSLRRDVGVSASNDLFGSCGTVTDGLQDLSLTVNAMVNVFVYFLIWSGDSRAMSAKQNSQTWKIAQSLEGKQVVAHISLWRVDQNRSQADDVVASEQHSALFIVETEMTLRVAGCMKGSELDSRLPGERKYLAAFNQIIDTDFGQGVRGLTMRSNPNGIAEGC